MTETIIKRGVTIPQIRIIVVLLATQGVKTRAYFYRPPQQTHVQQIPLRLNTTPGYHLTVAANAHTYQQRLGKQYS